MSTSTGNENPTTPAGTADDASGVVVNMPYADGTTLDMPLTAGEYKELSAWADAEGLRSSTQRSTSCAKAWKRS